MWVRRSAIRPVPPYARISEAALEAVTASLAEDEDDARAQLDAAFDQFEERQPALAAHIGQMLCDPLDDTALALGYFLALTVWLAFEHSHGEQVEEVLADEITATQELLDLDEEMRRSDPSEALDTEDIVAMAQPALMRFIHDHVDATLQAHAETVDVDDVHLVYRAILVQLLALSYRVRRPAGFPVARSELLA